jgi:hypothetical protein
LALFTDYRNAPIPIIFFAVFEVRKKWNPLYLPCFTLQRPQSWLVSTSQLCDLIFHFRPQGSILYPCASSAGAKAGLSEVYLSMEEAAFQVIYPPVQPESRSAAIWALTSLGP